MGAEQATSGARRRTKWLWNLACLVFLVLAGMAFGSSQAWQAPDVPDLAPPYETPDVASSLPQLADVSEAVGSPVVLFSEGPPQAQLFTSNTAMAKDLRANLLTGAWERSWVSLEDTISVDIRLFEVRRADSTYGTDHCLEGEQITLPTAHHIARHEGSGGGREWYCATLSEGRTRAWVDLSVRTSQASRITPEKALATLLGAVSVSTSPDDPLGKEYVSQQRAAILAAWIVVVPVGAALTVLAPLLFDRATLQRALARLRRGKLRTNHIDVTNETRTAAAKSRAIGVARLAALLWSVRLTEELLLGVLGSLAVVAGSYLATLLIERYLLNRRSGRNVPRAFTGRRSVWIAVGSCLTIATMAAAAWVWAAGSAMSAGATAPGLPDWEVHRFGVLVQFLSGAILLASLIPLALTRRIAMRRPAAWTHDSRPPILLLRSFIDDNLRMRSRRLDRAGILDQLALRRWERFEEVAAAALSKIGPVVAVGTPGQALPPGLGAVRIQLSHEEWQDRVTEIAENSAFLAMTLGRTESLVWEMRQLQARGHLDKTLFLVPPLPTAELVKRIETLAEVYGLTGDSVWPSGGFVPLVIAFPRGHSEPLVLVAKGADDLSYDAAIDQAVRALLRADVRGPLPIELVELEEPLNVIPMGLARPHKSWKRNPWFWNAVINVGVLSIAIPYALGGTIGQQVNDAAVLFNPNYRVTHVVPDSGDEPLVIFNAVHATRVSFEEDSIEEAWQFDAPVEEVVVDNETVYSTWRDEGKVEARDAATRKVLWSTRVGERVRGLSVSEETVYVALPAQRKVLALAADSGDVVQEATVNGHPWDVLRLGDFLYVPLIDRDELLELDASSLSEDQRVPTHRSPSEVTGWGGRPVIISRADHLALRLAAKDEDPRMVWLSRTEGEVVGIGQLLLAEGHDRISLVHVDGRVERHHTLGGRGGGISIADRGTVVAEENMIRLFRD